MASPDKKSFALRLDPAADVAGLREAARARGVPLALVDLAGQGAPAEYRHALLICREDQHVAWRGDAVPADPLALVDRLRGAPGAQPAGRMVSR